MAIQDKIDWSEYPLVETKQGVQSTTGTPFSTATR